MSSSGAARGCIGLFAALVLGAAPAAAKDPALVTFSAGVFDLVAHRTQEFEEAR